MFTRFASLSLFATCGLFLTTAFSSMAAAAERCLAVAKAPYRSFVQPASFKLAQRAALDVKLTFVGHATFLIESPQGIKIATDYNDYVRPSVVPDIVTMNRAHDTHFTNFPEPSIRHVLRGWNPQGGAAEHDVTLDDVRVRNVATNIRGWDGGTSQFGNSIFVFEIADLCIVHLGHLHHTLRPEQLAQIGQVDVLLVPVDGSYTLDLAGMMEVLADIRAPLMIPMHYFSRHTLERFLTKARDVFDVRESDQASLVLNRAMLPAQQQVLVLPGR
jgi:L-ascorbate metabolism protein UlaG (beta-lactamase superfamily)